MAAAGAAVPSEPFIKIITGDGHTFHVERKCAFVSSTIRTMMTGEMAEARENVARFPEIDGQVMERVIQYMHYKVKYSNSRTPPPDFRIAPEIALDLLMAANYLGC